MSGPPEHPPVAAPMVLCSKGRRMMKGTTARSWKRSTPRDAVPNLVVSIFLSANSCRPRALDDRLSAKPITTACSDELICKMSMSVFWILSTGPSAQFAHHS